MGQFIDLTGQRFNRLCVLSRAENLGRGGTRWVCRCDCGELKMIHASSLRGGGTQSCGCLQKEIASVCNGRHRRGDTPEYRAWSHLKARCLTPTDAKYKYYGARGIKVCDRWLHSFENLFADMGARPLGTTIGRMDNDGHYATSNCRREPLSQKGRHKRGLRHVSPLGRVQLMTYLD